MNTYIGTKIILARPMSQNEWCELTKRPLRLPPDNQPGYLVVYENGYESWSPKAEFEAAYQDIARGMNFGGALFLLKRGAKVTRRGWNGAGQWVVLMPELKLPAFSSQTDGAKVNDRTARHIGEDTPLDSQPYFSLWNAQRKWQPGWTPSVSDCLAEDWVVVA